VSDMSPRGATPRATIGPYEILKILERGDRETLYLGIEPASEREVVIRVSSDVDSVRLGDAAAREATLARRLVHRHLLRVFDAGEDEGLSYVVEEVRRGHTLADMPKDRLDTFDMAARLDLVAQLCTGLHFLHAHGLIHGEVKPANVFVTTDGVVKLLNVGPSPADEMTIVSDNALAGSFEYNSPEQLQGRAEIDGRSDIFSAAVILYELVSGRRPFHGSSTRDTLERINHADPTPLDELPELNGLIRRGLDKDPDKRFRSAQEFAYALWVHVSQVQVEDQAADAQVDTVYVERATASETGEEVIARGPDLPLLSKETFVYAGIAAVVVLAVGLLLRTC
jgi:eukaryotic-like serine/threonine-protein kinase